MKKISHIHYITRNDANISHSEQAKRMFEKGIACVQIRMKGAEFNEVLNEVKKAKVYADATGNVLMVDDWVEVAKQCEVGVHLGLNDMPADEARKILGNNAIIGGTANTFDDVLMQFQRGCDYIGLGPYRFTKTKKNLSPVLGAEGYKEIIKKLNQKQINIPIIAIGGIEINEFDFFQSIGVYGIAASESLFQQIKQ